MPFFKGWGKYSYLARLLRSQYEAALRCAYAGQAAQGDAKPPDFHAKAHAMGVIGMPCPECSVEERIP